MPDGEKRLTIRTTVSIQYQHWTDRQTDGRTKMANEDRAVRKVKRDKNGKSSGFASRSGATSSDCRK